MIDNLPTFFLHWGVMSLSLWVATFLFKGIKFADPASLIVSALLLGFVNAIVKPLLIILTLPLTLLTLGLFLLVINALMIMLVAALVRGFIVAGFWTAFFTSIFISLLNFVIDAMLIGGEPSVTAAGSGTWL
ncbi:MAG: phage holin family protein [Pseudomonadota bacterium]